MLRLNAFTRNATQVYLLIIGIEYKWVWISEYWIWNYVCNSECLPQLGLMYFTHMEYILIVAICVILEMRMMRGRFNIYFFFCGLQSTHSSAGQKSLWRWWNVNHHQHTIITNCSLLRWVVTRVFLFRRFHLSCVTDDDDAYSMFFTHNTIYDQRQKSFFELLANSNACL